MFLDIFLYLIAALIVSFIFFWLTRIHYELVAQSEMLDKLNSCRANNLIRNSETLEKIDEAFEKIYRLQKSLVVYRRMKRKVQKKVQPKKD